MPAKASRGTCVPAVTTLATLEAAYGSLLVCAFATWFPTSILYKPCLLFPDFLISLDSKLVLRTCHGGFCFAFYFGKHPRSLGCVSLFLLVCCCFNKPLYHVFLVIFMGTRESESRKEKCCHELQRMTTKASWEAWRKQSDRNNWRRKSSGKLLRRLRSNIKMTIR